MLGHSWGIEYTSAYLPVGEAQEQEAKYHQSGNTKMEYLMNVEALYGSPLCNVPNRNTDKFDFTPMTLEEIFISFQK
jgi:hypothetical protein